MKIIAENLGKRFGREWVFRKFSYEFKKGEHYAIVGANGSGKSTLLKVLSTWLEPTEGGLKFLEVSQDKHLQDNTANLVAFAAPYSELPELFDLDELYTFYAGFKPLACTKEQFLELLQMKYVKGKPIKYFSSGMKQKVKLALAFSEQSPLLLLDEPSTNLDKTNFDWLLSLLNKIDKQKILIVSSNIEAEYSTCSHILPIDSYKN
ncbi:MAG: ATP-binding cassette domain-containing protein [Cytophagales bacterium]|nr:MAG: ATP-binding cassette domain-containing protein [Cytophagales bacterium]TAF62386.1 MAG: ATP-binding cassette domain-containing protein [Cytophagales bacterium]